MRPFLTAYWKNLINLTYKVPPDLLFPHIPEGVELDVQEGSAFVSLVAFDFLDTRVRGLKIPFHVNFPEINLRYYLKYKGKRGVAFLKEWVPRYCIALVARKVYNEPYADAPMTSEISGDNRFAVTYTLTLNKKTHSIQATATNSLHIPGEDTEAHYFKEHDIGFGKSDSGKTLYYEVRHPKWRIYDTEDIDLDWDFAEVYGEKWGFLNDAAPHCSCLAEGSGVEVFPAGSLEKWA